MKFKVLLRKDEEQTLFLQQRLLVHRKVI